MGCATDEGFKRPGRFIWAGTREEGKEDGVPTLETTAQRGSAMADLEEILDSPLKVPFSRIKYIARYGTPEDMAKFLRGLYLTTMESKDSGAWEDLSLYLEEWETWAMALRASNMQTPDFESIPWAPLTKPLHQSSFALVSTGGIYVEGQEPYDVDSEDGDYSFREIPRDTPQERIRVRHPSYDISGPLTDINCVLPLHRFRELKSEGVIGDLSPSSYSFMGLIRQPEALMEETAPEVARRLKEAGVDAAFLTST